MIKILYNLHTGDLNIYTGGDSRVVLLVKRLPGREYHKDRYWTVPVIIGSSIRGHVDNFIANVKDLGLEIEITDSVWDAIEFSENWKVRNLELSLATVSHNPKYNTLFDGELTPTMRASVDYMRYNGSVICGDDESHNPMTSALAAIEADLLYPALIVCRDSRKITINSEFRRRTRRPAFVVDTEHIFVHDAREAAGVTELAQVCICAFGKLEEYRLWLSSMDWRALIIDEAGAIRGGNSIQAAILLDLGRKENLKRILLSRTDIHARPWELIAQLEIAGKMADLGGRADYIERYTIPGSEQTVWKPRNTQELEKRLREVCYIAHGKIEPVQEVFPNG